MTQIKTKNVKVIFRKPLDDAGRDKFSSKNKFSDSSKSEEKLVNSDFLERTNDWYWCPHPIDVWTAAFLDVDNSNDCQISLKTTKFETLFFEKEDFVKFLKCEKDTLVFYVKMSQHQI